MAERSDGRKPNELRKVTITPGYLDHAEGSCLVEFGQTRVLCAASVEDRQPGFLRNTDSGWVTAEYGMLPRATHTRGRREAAQGKQSGRTQEIQRLVARSLRATTDLDLLGPRTLTVDCDVLQADGGTRTASITGGYVALRIALDAMVKAGKIPSSALVRPVAAVSVGVIKGEALLDVCYEEDSTADVDINVVMTGADEYVEVQGTAEGAPFSRAEMDGMLDLAKAGILELFEKQREALATLA